MEAAFAHWAVREVLVLVILNADISGSIHPTVFRFGEHTHVNILFVPNKFHVFLDRAKKWSPLVHVFSAYSAMQLQSSISQLPLGRLG